MYQRILVAVDAAAETAGVLARTAELAKALGAHVRVLHVQAGDVVDGGGAGGVVEEENATEAQKVVANAIATLRAAGVTDVEGLQDETLRNDVPRVVLDQVAEYRADLLVLGVRRHGGLARLFLGSVSDAIVHRAPCPVLLVP